MTDANERRFSFADGVAVLEPYQSTRWPRAVIVKTVLPLAVLETLK
jgi:hypothetical protein